MYKGDFTTANTVYFYFASYDSNDPTASVTLTGLALADIKIYKDGGVTQRSSTSGFTLLDTDGIDFDGITGINGFSVDLSDDTDASFYAAGSEYTVIVNSVTIDAGVINFVADDFSIERTGGALALLKHASYGLDQLVRSTTPANTLDVEAGGCAGVDWANVANPTTAVGLSGTDIQLADTVTTLSGHTPQTGDNFPEIGTAGAGLTDLGGMSTAMKAEVNTEAKDVLFTDATVEPTSPPASTAPIADKISYNFMGLKNRGTQTSTERKIYANDGTTLVSTSTVSDDTVTFEKGKDG